MNRGVHIMLLLGCLVAVGCRDRGFSSDKRDGGQLIDLSVSIAEGVSKAPIMGATFADGTHLFGLAVTQADGVTAYEAGSSNVWASAVVAGASQTWSYQWGTMSAPGAVLPILYGGDPMQVAGYYPYNAAAAGLEGRDGGRLNVPFDLTTSAEQTNQTDVLYSPVQTVDYATGNRQSVALPFRHLYALLEFQIKLKTEGVAASITKVEVCNKAGKSFLANKGYFSPYTGALTASTAGTVSFTTATALNATTYATIRVLVPPTLLAEYADGDMYVQMYDNGAADPKQFPILKAYLTQSGTYGLVGGGQYSYKLLYDHTYGTISVTGWSSTVLPDEEIGSGAPPLYVEVNGLRWATGNLVASSPTAGKSGVGGCKIGSPGDGGLYFQFGSLIGWKGGAQVNGGNGMGIPQAPLTTNGTYWNGSGYNWNNDAMVWPSEMSTTPSAWPSNNGATAGDRNTVVDQYFFNYNVAPYATAGQNIRGFAGSFAGDAGTGDLGTGRYAKWGVGDPCSYYLGGTWRLPTTEELVKLCNGQGGSDWITWTVVGGSWTTDPTQKGGNFQGTKLFLPAAGNRGNANGSFYSITTHGRYWSSSVGNATVGYNLVFVQSNGVVPQDSNHGSYGFPVRCVQSMPSPTNPPTESDYIEINGLRWTKGNLVAVNGNECKVGAPGDHGLYFQFGGLIGYKGGASGSGVGSSPYTGMGTQWWGGAGSYSWANDAMVWPAESMGIKTSWANTTGSGITTLSDYCFNYSLTPWETTGQNIREFSLLPGTGTGTLGTGRYAALGVGDACTYYLGDPWRLPTSTDYVALHTAGAGEWTTNSGVTGRWLGPSPGTASSSVFFPASGLRHYSNGAFYNVAASGYCWSSSVSSDTYGFGLAFHSGGAGPQNGDGRSSGFPVRCVSSAP